MCKTTQNFELNENEKDLNMYEESLLKKGEINNTIGLFRALLSNKGSLSKKRFIFLVKKNNFLKDNDDLPEEILSKIDNIWMKSRAFLKDLKILEKFSEDKIIIKDLKDFLAI